MNRKAIEGKDKSKTYGKVEWVEGSEPKVGVGVTRYLYTDSSAYTIVEVINPKKVVVRPCKATLKESFNPDFQAGGFHGHVSNNESQEYDYEDILDAPTTTITLRKDGV